MLNLSFTTAPLCHGRYRAVPEMYPYGMRYRIERRAVFMWRPVTELNEIGHPAQLYLYDPDAALGWMQNQ